MTEYSEARQVERVAERVIAQHHPHLSHVPIVYVFRDKAAKSKGKEKWGTARKMSGLNAFLSAEHAGGDDYFVIEIAEDVWTILDATEREALVDHELSHCTIDEEDNTLAIVGHDVEEFADVIRRRGLWSEGVREAIKAAEEHGQLTFDDAEEEED